MTTTLPPPAGGELSRNAWPVKFVLYLTGLNFQCLINNKIINQILKISIQPTPSLILPLQRERGEI